MYPPETLGNDTQMPAMFELAFHSDDMFLVFRVGVVQSAKDLRLFPSSDIPAVSTKIVETVKPPLTCSLATGSP